MLGNMGDYQARKLHESLRIELDYKNEYTNADIMPDLEKMQSLLTKNENGNIQNHAKTTSYAKPNVKKKTKDTMHLQCDLRVFDK